MADEDKTGDGQDAKPKSKMPLILVLVVLLLGGGGGAAFFLSRKSPKAAKTDEDVGSGKKIGPLLALKSFIINLNDQRGSRYLKLAVDLELRKPLTEAQSKATVRVRDKMIVYLSGLKMADVQARKAKLKLKRELVRLANEGYGAKRVRNAYFKEFVIQ